MLPVADADATLAAALAAGAHTNREPYDGYGQRNAWLVDPFGHRWSIDFFLSGRSLPAWVTGLAFISANLGAVEIIGHVGQRRPVRHPDGALLLDRRRAGDGVPRRRDDAVLLRLQGALRARVHAPAVRSRGAHLVNALSFALAQLLIAGINLFLLAKIVDVLLGWPLWVAVIVAAAIVLTYITLGGLSAAIYNEVLQFFVIVAALLPLTLVGLHKVGGYSGLKDKIAATAAGADQLNSWPGTNLTGIDNPVLSVIGIVFGLGFVLSFGYWTTNFVEVQRAMASSSISSARARRSSAPSRRCSSRSS